MLTRATRGSGERPVQTRLELTWPNKDKFLLMPRDAGGQPVWVETTHPASSEVRLSTFTDAIGDLPDGDAHADNLVFTGDSLDALRILTEVPEFRRHYRGKVALVYIDPPFNTGQTFTHYDDWMEHSTWLSFMRDRLLLIKELLSADGSVMVHLDDAEVHRMRCLMDEIFGAGNFVGSIVWRSSDNSNNDAKTISLDHNTILVYSKRPGWQSRRLPATLEDLPHFKNPDKDPRGPWFDGNPLNSPAPRPELTYDIVGPNGDVISPPTNGWRWSRETLEQRMATGEIRFTADGKGIRRRTYFADHKGLPPSSLWADITKTGASRQAKTELKKLFPGTPTRDLFDTPKPERLLQRIVHIATQPGDIVVDCFGGSGTTAAVAHKMGRRWVTCELSPQTVRDVTRERLEKVVLGQDPGGISADLAWTGGGGFRVVEIGPSMYEVLDTGLVVLADWATNGAFARAVAGQLGFDCTDDAPFCGRRGRMRLAVLDGAVGPEEIRDLVSRLDERERLTVVAKAVLPETEDTLAKLSPGSRMRKAPRDLLTPPRKRRSSVATP